MNERHRKKSDNADIILKRKNILQYKKRTVSYAWTNPSKLTILQTRGNRNTADTTKEKGVQKQKSISQTCLYCFSKLAKGHISSPGLREGQKINKQKQTKTAVLSPFPTGGVAHFWLFTCLLTVLHNTPLGIWFTTSKQLTYKTYGARDGFIWFFFLFLFFKERSLTMHYQLILRSLRFNLLAHQV